jgi:hypothetical protein
MACRRPHLAVVLTVFAIVLFDLTPLLAALSGLFRKRLPWF